MAKRDPVYAMGRGICTPSSRSTAACVLLMRRRPATIVFVLTPVELRSCLNKHDCHPHHLSLKRWSVASPQLPAWYHRVVKNQPPSRDRPWDWPGPAARSSTWVVLYSQSGDTRRIKTGVLILNSSTGLLCLCPPPTRSGETPEHQVSRINSQDSNEDISAFIKVIEPSSKSPGPNQGCPKQGKRGTNKSWQI